MREDFEEKLQLILDKIDPSSHSTYHRPMLPIVSAEQMREIDRLTMETYDVLTQTLMDSASSACFDTISRRFDGDLTRRHALVLCGKGNNGGDGAGLAGMLVDAGVAC